MFAGQHQFLRYMNAFRTHGKKNGRSLCACELLAKTSLSLDMAKQRGMRAAGGRAHQGLLVIASKHENDV